MKIHWQTFHNYIDCGLFLMRHIETYKGNKNTLITQFKNEKVTIARE